MKGISFALLLYRGLGLALLDHEQCRSEMKSCSAFVYVTGRLWYGRPEHAMSSSSCICSLTSLYMVTMTTGVALLIYPGFIGTLSKFFARNCSTILDLLDLHRRGAYKGTSELPVGRAVSRLSCIALLYCIEMMITSPNLV